MAAAPMGADAASVVAGATRRAPGAAAPTVEPVVAPPAGATPTANSMLAAAEVEAWSAVSAAAGGCGPGRAPSAKVDSGRRAGRRGSPGCGWSAGTG